MTRSVKQIVRAQKVNMGGILLDQALPLRGLDQIDPVLLIHHWSDTLKGGKKQSEVGVGPHPHRGFSPVTFIFKGGVHHRDSAGAEEVVYAGGTQWMNSGSGVVHSERPAKELAEGGGDFEIIQFWINSPASKKMKAPSYQPLHAETTPQVVTDQGRVRVGAINGEYGGKTGTIEADSPLLILRMEMESGGKVSIPVPESYNTLVYVLDGEVALAGDQKATNKDMIHFANDGKGISLEATADTRAIVLSGEPIDEEVATYGPFVMNTEQELRQAIMDYQNGKMGNLKEEFED